MFGDGWGLGLGAAGDVRSATGSHVSDADLEVDHVPHVSLGAAPPIVVRRQSAEQHGHVGGERLVRL